MVTPQWAAKQACIKLHRYVYGSVSQLLLRVSASKRCMDISVLLQTALSHLSSEHILVEYESFSLVHILPF